MCSLHYLGLHHRPTHRRISTTVSHFVSACWLCVRSSPRDGFQLRNDRCMACGWLTGNLYVDDDLCYGCHNYAICMSCTYMVPGIGRYCIQCDHMTEYVNSAQLALVALINHCDVVCDAFHRCGDFCNAMSMEGKILSGLVFHVWKQVCHYGRCRVLNCPICLELRPMYGLTITSPRRPEAVKYAWQHS